MTIRFLLLAFASLLSLPEVFGQRDSNPKNEVKVSEIPIYMMSGELGSLRVETPVKTSDLLIYLSCKDSTELSSYIKQIPEECITQYEENKAKGTASEASKQLNKCIVETLTRPGSNAQVDTLYIVDESLIPQKIVLMTDEQVYFATKAEMYDEKHQLVYRTEFHNVSDLKNVCIDGEYRKHKSQHWTNGKPDEKWETWDKSGKLILKEQYENGKLVKKEEVKH